ncbi:hypothetical protein FGO68_gene12445 [Halteria grandinella]|uniref:TRAF-type domain-containing protein n=1 Tax=Halteria grandinella TaxID=5974 RepID=A0A8J8T1X6_HALGN|nr:hypothetical protein FGO68_gene12445 [Halteria grandinella]
MESRTIAALQKEPAVQTANKKFQRQPDHAIRERIIQFLASQPKVSNPLKVEWVIPLQRYEAQSFLLCMKCKNVLQDPKECDTCNLGICGTCEKKVTQNCPNPQCELSSDQKVQFRNFNKVWKNKLDMLVFTCPLCQVNSFNTNQYKHAEFIQHINLMCPKRKVPCPNLCTDANLVLNQVEYSELFDHLVKQCSKTVITCVECGKDDVNMKDRKNHNCLEVYQSRLEEKDKHYDILKEVALQMKKELQDMFIASTPKPQAPTKTAKAFNVFIKENKFSRNIGESIGAFNTRVKSLYDALQPQERDQYNLKAQSLNQIIQPSTEENQKRDAVKALISKASQILIPDANKHKDDVYNFELALLTEQTKREEEAKKKRAAPNKRLKTDANQASLLPKTFQNNDELSDLSDDDGRSINIEDTY